MKKLSRLLPALRKKLVISSVSLLVFAFLSGVFLFELTKTKVVLAQNGEQMTVKTHANTVNELLENKGIIVHKHDLLSVDKDATLTNGMKIKYQAAKHIYVVTDGGKPESFATTEKTVHAFLDDTDQVNSHDDVKEPENTLITDGMTIHIQKGFQVTIHNGVKKDKLWTTGGTVGDILADNHISFDKDSADKIKPALNDQVTKTTPITITRVKTETKTIEQEIPYEDKQIEDDHLLKGNKEVRQAGSKGVMELTYKITKENGKEVKRQQIGKDVIKQPKNHITVVGTMVEKPKLKPRPKPKQSSQPKKQTDNTANVMKTSAKSHHTTHHSAKQSSQRHNVLHVTATAYTGDCAGCSGYTATGMNLKNHPNAKIIAVDPSVIPIGTKVWVEGYGTAIAADTGGFSGNNIDVHVPSKKAARKFGRQQVKVKILH